jgi:glycogen operon protein
VEGPTSDPAILALREKQKRNLLTTLILSQGVPMLLAGDEMGHTQGGNNNAYCQDNQVSWLDWEPSEAKRRLLDFTRRLIRIWKEQPVLKRRQFFQGRNIRGSKDIAWYDPEGKEMSEAAWTAGFMRCLGVLWSGKAIDEMDEEGERIVGDSLLILFNAHHEAISFVLPERGDDRKWELLLDTHLPDREPSLHPSGQLYDLKERSVSVFRRLRAGGS